MKVVQYIPEIEDGIPIPERTTAIYTRKIVKGELIRLALEMKPGQSVRLPAGSVGKFSGIVKSRGGLTTICSMGQTDAEARVWVIESTPQSTA